MTTPPQKLCLLHNSEGLLESIIAAAGPRLACATVSNAKLLWEIDITNDKQSASETGDEQDQKHSDSSIPFIRTLRRIPGTNSVLALCDDKTLRTIDCTTGQCKAKIKRAESFTMTNDHKYVLVADKFGDVWRYPLETNSKHSDELLLGHLSTIADILQSSDGNFVITCDKDEHIRVSHYPNAFDIENFCLAHQDFISSLLIPASSPDILISASCDGMIHVWHWRTASLVQSVDTSSIVPKGSSRLIFKIVESPSSAHILILFARSNIILSFSFNQETLLANSIPLSVEGTLMDLVYDQQSSIWTSQVTDGEQPTQQSVIATYTLEDGNFKKREHLSELTAVLTSTLSGTGTDFSLKQIFWIEELRKQSSNGT